MDQNHSYNNPDYDSYQPQHGPVKDTYAYILIGTQIWQLIVSVFFYISFYRIMQYQATFGNIPTDFKLLGFVSTLSGLSSLLNMVGIVFIIIDIVQLKNQNYPMTGLILFAIFLRPAYYIWRCYILGRKMTPAIIYTVVYYVSTLAIIIWAVIRLYGFIAAMLM